jgi:hypothetical protein
VRIEDLRFGPNPPGGMNAMKLLAYAHELRSSTVRHVGGPVEVTRERDGFRVHDGRHRALAAMIAGRPDVECVLVKPGRARS